MIVTKKSKTVLVTGAAGFLGAHLCKSILDDGDKIIGVDNFTTGRESNIGSLLENPDFRFIEHDINSPLDVEVDQIFNLACPASPIQYQKDPVQTIKTNVQGVINMLELAKRLSVTMLQASTSEVYGDPEIHPQVEEYRGNVNANGIRACYDEGKRCAEALLFDYYRQYNVGIKIARIFNTFGPGMLPNDGRVVSNFIVNALSNKDVTVYGDGSQTRSFCYVDDLIRGLKKLMNTGDSVTGPINLGSPEEYTVIRLARSIINMTNSTSKIVFRPRPEDDPYKRKPSIEKAKELLDWYPTYTLDEGLQKTVRYFSALLKDVSNS
jgi:UDP-glucuronate decarboxylase